MNSSENFKWRTDFRAILRGSLVSFMEERSYKLVFDNKDLPDSHNERWIFKLIFKGDKRVEIRNRDWRDYTEYFHLSINDTEVLTLNIDKYQDLEKAYRDVETTIVKVYK